MITILCFNCGGMYQAPYDTKDITKQCPKCLPAYKRNHPDWCDDCTVRDGPCPDCGCTHNC